MKKSSFVTLVLGIFSALVLGSGMSMAILPDSGLYNQGVIVGCLGIIFSLITVIVHRKMTNKPKINLSLKTVGIALVAIIGVIIFGGGLSLTMVFNQLVFGTILAIIGIMALLSLIPLSKGLKQG